jgi:hypothetical protein
VWKFVGVFVVSEPNFPLLWLSLRRMVMNEAAVPAHFLPLHKSYSKEQFNMKRLLLTLAFSALCFAPEAFSQKVLGVINVGGQPGLLAINPTTNMLYDPNATLKTVTVVDGNTNQVVADVPMPATPVAAAVNSATNLIYVTTGYPSNSIVVIDGASNIVTATIPATLPGFIAVNSLTNLVYFSNLGPNLSVLDGSTNKIVATITTAYGIEGIAINQTANRIYLSEGILNVGDVVVVDGNTNHATTFQVPGACFLTSIAVDSAVNRIYVADNNCSGLYVISGSTGKLITTLLQPSYYGPMALNLSNHMIADFGIPSGLALTFVNGRTNNTIGSLAFPANGQTPISVAPGGNNRYYVAFSNSDDIAVVLGAHQSGKRPGPDKGQ